MSDRLPPEGWYADPDGDGERFWDGTKWTSATRGSLIGSPAAIEPGPDSDHGAYHRGDEDADRATVPIRPAPSESRHARAGSVAGGVIFFLVGVPFFVFGLITRASFEIPVTWVGVDAVVTDLDYAEGCAAVASYDVDGVTYRVVGDIYSTPCRVEIGATADVFYDPTNPAVARIDDSLSQWFPLVFMGMGALLSAIGAIALIARFRPV